MHPLNLTTQLYHLQKLWREGERAVCADTQGFQSMPVPLITESRRHMKWTYSSWFYPWMQYFQGKLFLDGRSPLDGCKRDKMGFAIAQAHFLSLQKCTLYMLAGGLTSACLLSHSLYHRHYYLQGVNKNFVNFYLLQNLMWVLKLLMVRMKSWSSRIFVGKGCISLLSLVFAQ